MLSLDPVHVVVTGLSASLSLTVMSRTGRSGARVLSKESPGTGYGASARLWVDAPSEGFPGGLDVADLERCFQLRGLDAVSTRQGLQRFPRRDRMVPQTTQALRSSCRWAVLSGVRVCPPCFWLICVVRPWSECPTHAGGSVPRWAHCRTLFAAAVLVVAPLLSSLSIGDEAPIAGTSRIVWLSTTCKFWTPG